ncbi:MAG TPA: hypothetical protein V6D00_13260 [Pantanalinema sp.]
MKRWIVTTCTAFALAGTLAVGAQAAPGTAKAAPKPSLENAEKLPVDLPSVLIRGEDETAGPLLPGNKLSPDEPGAMPFTLPRPRTALDLDRYLAQASESVTPSIAGPREAAAVPRSGYGEGRLGTLGLHRYDLGAYLGRAIALPVGLPLDAMTALGEIEGQTGAGVTPVPGDWSRWHLGLSAASESLAAGLAMDRRATTVAPGTGDALAEGLSLNGRYRLAEVNLRLEASGGRVAGPASLGIDSGVGQGALAGTWRPELGLADQTVEVAASIGHRRTEKRSDALVYVAASDEWAFMPRWSLNASLGLGHLYERGVIDPGLAVRYRPSDATELAAGLRAQTTMPTFEALYLSRRFVAGNGALVDQRVPLRLDLSGSHRLDDRWFTQASLSYLAAERWIAWRAMPGATGLWQPFNPGLSGDFGSATQHATEGELAVQYRAWDDAGQRFFYRWQTVQPLGEIRQEAGTAHESTWLSGKLKVDLGASVVLQQLGEGQTSAQTATGYQALLKGQGTYRLTPDLALYLRADALPLKQEQPALNFFAPDALCVAGVAFGF